ncbi:MAG TPA: hypothetical protein VHI52_07560 [Verrucomicrobiae bacterium]|nr:hypothetical protein [Verrucomicrobiae bacterium]
MEQQFTQTGGVRYGESFWYAMNFTVPFAELSVSKNGLQLTISVFGLWKRSFDFPRPSIRHLRWRRGLLSRGLQIEHGITEYPPFVLFWSGNCKTLGQNLKDLGYELSEKNSKP